jgi:hypothetical protein
VFGESTLTADGQRLLSIDFASPEQIDGTPLDRGSDIYALGATFYTLLTGRVPFPGDSWPVKVNRRFHGPVPQPSLAVPDLPPGLDAVVARALASDPAHRYASCRELAADARRALTAQSPTESPRATEPASTATQQAVTQRATRRQAAAERPSAAPTVLEPGPGDRSVARPDGPRAPHGRARRAVLIAVLVTVIAVAAGWFITSQRTSTSTSSNTPTASSSDASAAISPAVSTPPPTGETNGAPGPAATRPLSELLQPPAERRSGTVGGQPVAAAAAYAMTPKGCPTGTRQVTADLGGAYERVTANLALDDAAPAATRTNVVVATDGQELSRKILSPTEGTSWDLPVHGAGSLVITIETLGQGSCDADGYVVFVTDAVASVT